jgi:subtilisin-like proprotein convertase family protein
MRVFLLLSILVGAARLGGEERLELVRESLTGTHCRFRQYVRGIPTEEFVTRACDGARLREASLASEPLVDGTPLRIIDGRLARRVIVEEQPLERFAYDYDFESGALLRRMPLYFHAKPARVFDPNPVAATNDPTLQDRDDAASAVPDRAYRDVDLLDVAPSGPLRGPHVALVDRQVPSVAPPDASGPLVFDRAADGFEDVNVYFHIDRTQRHLQSLGYVGARAIAAYAIEADAHAAVGRDNSFFIASIRIGEGSLFFGEGGTDDAEDADLVVHEYGHAIHEWISPGTFSGIFRSESRALSEGFGDYWAYSAHVAQRLASGRDPFCFADWDARCWQDSSAQQCAYAPGSDCLRRLDSTKTMADYEQIDSAGTEHRNGMIWSSALREIHQNVGRAVADTIVIESLFDAPPRPTFAVMARRLLEADRLLYGGAHAQPICAAMLQRGILTSCADLHARGEQTFFQSSDHALPIPDANFAGVTSLLTITDARAIEEIFVRVDIVHRLRGDLRVELVAPDGTTIVLQQESADRAADIHATFGLTAPPIEPLDVLRGRSAAGVWKLIVRDVRSADVGTLLSWSVVLQLAGDERLSERPRAARAQMIPVVAHLFGVGATRFATDVRIANPSTERVSVSLIFTRSGEDGRVDFSVIEASVDPGQTIAFDDVVERAFHTAGSGTLEILGDVLVMSRTYAESDIGTMGQQVPTELDTTSLGEPPLLVAPLVTSADRYNLGIAETGGGFGVVRVGDRDVPIAPFSHVQFPITGGVTEVRVKSGEARISAYVSQVNNTSGDAMFIPAEGEPAQSRTLLAPAISADGANGAEWRSDLWLASTAGPQTIEVEGIGAQRPIVVATVERLTSFEDVLARLFHRTITLAALKMTLPARVVGGTRVRTGDMSQFLPLLPPNGPTEQHLLFIEKSAEYRTNVGIVADAPAEAEVVVFDAAGREIARQSLVTEGGVAQLSVRAPVSSGRAVVRFVSGSGCAYASLVDNRTGDATYVQGR